MRLYGGGPPYAVGHFLAKALLSVSSFSYLLDESLIYGPLLIRVVTAQHAAGGHVDIPSSFLELRVPFLRLAPACVFRTHPRAATPRRCPQLRATAALPPFFFAGCATYMRPLPESPPP